MILVDSSVWIDYFRGIQTQKTERLEQLLYGAEIAVGDLVIMEVLQGFVEEKAFEEAKRLFGKLAVIDIGGRAIAVQAATNFRYLRSQGITVRKTIDLKIATRCVEGGHLLLHNDRDFDAFEKHLGLIVVE